MSKIITLVPTAESPPQPTVKPKQKIKVASLNINTIFTGQTYFPLSIGLLQAYAQKFVAFPDCYDFMTPVFLPPSRRQVTELAEKLSEANILAASIYGWNEQKTLAIAREVKKINPNIIIIFGGPQIPDRHKQFQRVKKSYPRPEDLKQRRANWTEEYHRKYPFIDMACHGEGERGFTAVLDQMALDGCRNKKFLPSISYIDADGNFHHNSKPERMNDDELADAPSP